MSDIDREAAARAATSGPWFDGKYGSVHPGDGAGGLVGSICQMGSKSGMYPNWGPNSRHVAINDPATILADIERMRRLEAVRVAAHAVMGWNCTRECGKCADTGDCVYEMLLAALEEADDE